MDGSVVLELWDRSTLAAIALLSPANYLSFPWLLNALCGESRLENAPNYPYDTTRYIYMVLFIPGQDDIDAAGRVIDIPPEFKRNGDLYKSTDGNIFGTDRPQSVWISASKLIQIFLFPAGVAGRKILLYF